MRSGLIRLFSAVILGTVTVFFSMTSGSSAWAQEVPKELQEVGIEEKLGVQVDIAQLHFQDETGREVPLATYFQSGRPVLLTLVYYECANLCNFLLNGLTDTLKKFPWTPGHEFEIVTVSINPKEKPPLGASKKASYVESYGRLGAAQGWHFLTGQEPDILKLADQVGFKYRYDPRDQQYAHSAAIFILTPEGKVSRYLYGIEYALKDLKMSLLEASSGKIGTVIDRFLLFCYRYDEKTRKYSLYLTKVMQAGSAGTMVIFGGYLAIFWRRQRWGRKNSSNVSLS